MTELPDPSPDPPPNPYENLQRLGVAIDSPEELSPTEQSTILANLRQALGQEDDENVREDIRRLLRALRRRSEVTHATADEIDDLLRRSPGAGDAAAPPERESDAAHTAKTSTPEPVSPAISVGEPATSAANAEPTQPRMGMTPKAVAIAGAAMVAVIAIAAIAVFLLSSANKSAPATTARPSTASALVDVEALEGLLLSPAEINTVMGVTAMTVTKTSTEPYDDTTTISDPNCRAIGDEAELSAYAGSGFTALRAQALNPRTGAEQRLTAYVGEAVVLFPSTDQAAAFLPTAQQRWQACSNGSFTYTPDGQPSMVWDQGPVTATNGTLHSTATQENSNGYTCQRALTVTKNVAIDVDACSHNPADSAVKIAHQIAAKVPWQ